MTGIRIGCGEFAPGGEPITVPNLPVPVPDVVVPSGGNNRPRDLPPFIPPVGGGGGGREESWKCVIISPGVLDYVPPPAGFYYVNGFYRKCYKCDGLINPSTGQANPSPGEVGCSYTTLQECQANCTNPIAPIEDPRGPGEIPTGGGGGVGGGGTTTGPRGTTGPTTGGPGDRGYRCQQTVTICLEDIGKPQNQQRVLSISHNCVACGGYSSNNSRSLRPEGPPRPSRGGNTATEIYSTECAFKSAADCRSSCPPGPITAKFVTSCEEPVNTVQYDPPSNSAGTRYEISVINIEESGQIATNVAPIRGTSTSKSEIYHNTYNFFQVTEKEPGTPTKVSLGSYQNVFTKQVATPIANLVNRSNTSLPWRERDLFSLRDEHIEASLSPQLRYAFESIHQIGGQLVGKQKFIDVVRKHLVTGTMDEFDPQFYIDVARNQSKDKRVKYVKSEDSEISHRAALGLVSTQSVVADPNAFTNLRKRQMRRQRRFNTDVAANCNVETFTEQTSLYLTDAGIPVETLDGDSFSVPTGDGDGYYMDIQQLDGTHVPIITNSDYSSTYYVPPETRINALSLINVDSSYNIFASSLENKNELVTGDAGASALKPLYFKLDLESVTYETTEDPLVSKYKGRYTVEYDQDEIDTHTINNGIAITRVNLDYRDPIYRYILDSGRFDLTLNDINLSRISNIKDLQGGVRFSRNIPFGLVIVPVRGSKFNPFNGFSDLLQFGDVCTRFISLVPSIDTFDNKLEVSDLKGSNLFYEENGALKVGLVEPNDSQNVIYKFDPNAEKLTKTFYTNGDYSTSTSPVSAYGISYMIREVIDYIIDTHNPEEVLWYDIIRRMPLNKIGEYLYDNNPELVSYLERGYRGGLLIKSAINTINTLDDKVLNDDNKVIIKKEDR